MTDELISSERLACDAGGMSPDGRARIRQSDISSNPISSPHELMIVAGGGEDMSGLEMLDWIRPLLAGLSKSHWAAFVLKLDDNLSVSARLHVQSSRRYYTVHRSWNQDDVEKLRDIVPSVDELLVILLTDGVSQVFTLVDAVASWLTFVDPNGSAGRLLCSIIDVGMARRLPKTTRA